jgi:TolA-binding protein
MRSTLFAICFVLLGLACAPKRPENFYFGEYSDAESLYNRGQYEQAIQKYQSYLDENPEGNLAVISQYYIAKSHLALGHFEDAKRIFQSIITKHPDVVWANFSETQLKEVDKLQAESLRKPPVPTESSKPKKRRKKFFFF